MKKESNNSNINKQGDLNGNGCETIKQTAAEHLEAAAVSSAAAVAKRAGKHLNANQKELQRLEYFPPPKLKKAAKCKNRRVSHSLTHLLNSNSNLISFHF